LAHGQRLRPAGGSTIDGNVIRLSNVASITPGVRNSKSAGWFNRDPVGLADHYQGRANANVIDTWTRIYALLPEIKERVPAGLDISVADRPHPDHPRQRA